MTMVDIGGDVRLRPTEWSPAQRAPQWRLVALAAASTAATVWYLTWLLHPERVGNPILFALLITAEIFNLLQAVGFWWTCIPPGARTSASRRPPAEHRWPEPLPFLDVLIPTYNEPVEVVEPTIAAANRLLGARVRVALLDDGDRPEMAAMAARWEARYVCRSEHTGAKAGNLNHALRITDAPFVAILDCDHVPREQFFLRTMARFADPAVAFVQTPQFYANADDNPIAAAAWSQQALFFGPIACGKEAHESMFCCGTNVVFRRQALESIGGFPESSLTEDFELSLRLHQAGWRSAYVPVVLASGLGPEDMASYVSQQHRWARGCISAIPGVLRARLPARQRLQYLLSASYFLSGWTVLIYLSLPVIRILTGQQPIAGAGADEFLAHFAGYFGLALITVAAVGTGAYTFAAYALSTSIFWVHVHATVKAIFRRPSRFVVTPKAGETGRQWRPIAPALAAITVLLAAAFYGLASSRQPATLNNVAFAALHIFVLARGISPAVLTGLARAAASPATIGVKEPRPAAWYGRTGRRALSAVTSTNGLPLPTLPEQPSLQPAASNASGSLLALSDAGRATVSRRRPHSRSASRLAGPPAASGPAPWPAPDVDRSPLTSLVEPSTVHRVNVVAVLNKKGGVGKTTTLAGLAFSLHRRGVKVGVIDVDDNGSATHWFADIPDIEMMACHHSELGRLIANVGDAFDVLLVDGPPNDEAAIASIAAVSGLVLVPLAPTGIEVDQLPGTVHLIPQTKPWIVVPVRVRLSTAAGRHIGQLLTRADIAHTASIVPLAESIASSFGAPTPEQPFADLTTEVLELLEKGGEQESTPAARPSSAAGADPALR